VGDIQATSSIDAETFHRVGEAWVQQTFAAGRVRLKVGRVDANTEFDGLPEAGTFLNASAGFSPTILFLPTYPSPVLSANLFVRPLPWLTLGGGVYDDDFGTGWNGGDGQRAVFGIGETHVEWGSGSVGFGLWRKAGAVERRDGSSGRGTMGWSAHGAQRVWSGSPAGTGESGPDLTLVAQYGAADAQVSDISRHLSVGLVATGVLGAGSEHAAGVRYSRVALSRYGLEPYAGDEVNWEVFVMLPATPFLTLTPDLQYVVRPSGGSLVGNALVVTVRAALTL
jgi:porin